MRFGVCFEVIDAEIQECHSPEFLVEEARTHWEKEISEATIRSEMHIEYNSLREFESDNEMNDAKLMQLLITHKKVTPDSRIEKITETTFRIVDGATQHCFIAKVIDKHAGRGIRGIEQAKFLCNVETMACIQ